MPIVNFFHWFVATPTPIITTVSVVIAFFAYKHQRKVTRKNKACEVAQMYEETIIPRTRYIKAVFDQIQLLDDINKFGDYFEDFNSKELSTYLAKAGFKVGDFNSKLRKINCAILDKAYSFSGCGQYITGLHDNLKTSFASLGPAKKNGETDGADKVFTKFVIDMLNDMESIAILFRYNIADEDLVYQLMHQTFLKNMSVWYFFIADENHIDYDQYFLNMIWLYGKWYEQKNKDVKKLKKMLNKNTHARKL